MAEDAYKKRLRERKRIIRRDLESKGYHTRSFDDGAFHIEACKGTSAKKIRIVFGFCDKGDILSVSREPVPYRCSREIWQVSDDGRSIAVVSVKGKVYDPLVKFK